MAEDIAYLSAAGITEAYRGATLSPVEVTAAATLRPDIPTTARYWSR